MRVAYYCVEGSTIAWALRLKDEGCDVLVYHQSKDHRKVGTGLVNLIGSREDWMRWGLLDENTLWFFDCTSTPDYDIGPFADRLRRAGRFVVGGGTFMDRLECDRAFGEKFAADCGIQSPPTQQFSTVSESIQFIKSNPKQEHGDGGWAWKPDKPIGPNMTFVDDPEKVLKFLESMVVPQHGDRVPCIVQERVKGVALSTARWFNGNVFTGPFEGTLEQKKLMNGNKGPATGCSFNALWFYREPEPKIAKDLQWSNIELAFRKHQAPPGLYDINAVVNKRGAWFLEWTPRLGIDSELTSQRAIDSLSKMLASLATGGSIDERFDLDEAYMSVRVSVPPYPFEGLDKPMDSPAIGVPVWGYDGLWNKHFVGVGVGETARGLEVMDPYGFAGIVLVAGTSLRKGYEAVYAYLDKKLTIPDVQFRTDAYDVVRSDIEAMAKAGYYTTTALEIE